MTSNPEVALSSFPQGVEAPKQVRPASRQDGDNVLVETLDHLAKMDEVLTTNERGFGASTHLLDPPILAALNARQWRKFHAIHARHHAPDRTSTPSWLSFHKFF